MSLRLKRAMIAAGFILLVIGLVVGNNFVKGSGFGLMIAGFVAAGGV